ncbi:Crp/Fnr family transcriptional regulator [Thiohalomonas denitrificans]|uniref:cAMP-binding domain of CRP or a regulatory subunit of cAMP-dependent protein kinases n=1 Tax=Thiohalomonas denitrificans TaxID=415747 RepID=A0A1G5QYX6_9GAMM|nr:Crp/Fnr family transcriptional regulator [Thiohalomonas denitrificans]SCZ66798.1 cAMP-binding domain of CRP or a regulatory subunit of cAMP-dependent protein kinases [Thiohalomonas denitrificans]
MDLSKALKQLRTDLEPLVPIAEPSWAAGVPLFLPVTLQKGEHAVEAGNRVESLLFLTSGIARYYYLDGDGREFNKSFSGRGQVLSSISSLVDGCPSPFSIQALTPSEGLEIRYRDFLKLTREYPDWERLRVRLLELLVIKKERREADFLLLSATERYRKFREEFAAIADAIPNYHIASYLGITEVALSRIRNRLGLTRVNAARHD